MFRAFVGRAQPRDRGQPVVHGIVFELPVGYDLHRFPIERRGCGRARELAETAQHVERETFGRVLIDFPAYPGRSEEHTSELQSLMRISYAVFCLKKTNCYTKKHMKKDTPPHKTR